MLFRSVIDAGLDSLLLTAPVIRMIGDSEWQRVVVDLLQLDQASDSPVTGTNGNRGRDPSGGPN